MTALSADPAALSPVLARDSRDLAQELYQLLRSMERSQWGRAAPRELGARLTALQAQLEALVERARAEAVNAELAALRQRLVDLSATTASPLPPLDLPAERARAAWAELRARLVPAYEELAGALHAFNLDVPSVRPHNLARSLTHMGSGVASLLVCASGYAEYAVVGLVLFQWSLDLGRWVSPRLREFMNTRFRLIAHPHEMHRITSSSWYSLGLAAAMVISGGVGPAAYLGAAILGFSDPAAGLVGRRFGRHRIVNGRSVEGSAAFVVAGLVAGIAALLLSGSVASLPVAAILALGAVLPAALVELFVRRIDDNLTIPVAAALGARATELLLLPALGLA